MAASQMVPRVAQRCPVRYWGPTSPLPLSVENLVAVVAQAAGLVVGQAAVRMTFRAQALTIVEPVPPLVLASRDPTGIRVAVYVGRR